MKALVLALSIALFASCGNAPRTNNAVANNTNAVTPEKQNLTVVERPQKIKDLMASRGEQDNAAPTLKIMEPKARATITTSTVKVKLEISGDLKGYRPGMNEETHTGNHIHVILDNQPYEAYYNLDREFELRNVTDGEHTIRVFPSRPWHESYKNEGAFQMVKFTVKGGGADPSKPATTSNGNTMSNTNASENPNLNAVPTPEGKEMTPSNASKGPDGQLLPLLTYSRPKGEYKGSEADAIMIDFWISDGMLKDDGGAYRVRWSVDGSELKFIDKWAPIWLTGWTAGKHTIKLDLIDVDGNLINGGYNSTERTITITK